MTTRAETATPEPQTPDIEVFNKNAKRLIVLTAEESKKLGYQYFGTEHFLLVAVRKQEAFELAGVFNNVCR